VTDTDDPGPAAEFGPPPPAAAAVFADRLPLAVRFGTWLAAAGVHRGLLGPREVTRLWERHLINSAVLTELLPHGSRVVDVGTGAGLPGVAMAIRRVDLRIDLVEPMQRRVDFLTEMLADLGLDTSIRVIRGRAEEAGVVREVGGSDWVVARAVAPLDRLGRWCLPLLAPGGRLLAVKGESAGAEAARHGPALRRLGADEIEVRRLGAEWPDAATWVVVARRSATARPARPRRARA
jgi:16S rRNA (guanine527-N7)-methyltransferase